MMDDRASTEYKLIIKICDQKKCAEYDPFGGAHGRGGAWLAGDSRADGGIKKGWNARPPKPMMVISASPLESTFPPATFAAALRP